MPTDVIADEAVYEEMYDSVERATTTATGLDAEQDRGIIRDVAAQTRGRIIDKLDADEGVTLVNEAQGRNDQDMFDTGVLDDDEVIAKKEVSTVDPVTNAGEVVTTVDVEVSAAAITLIISMDDITLAKALASLKSAKPMSLKDKGKAKMIKPEKPLKKKDHIMIDEEVARNIEAQLQAELEEEERLARQNKEEANIALIAE
uniref:Uncharacterized protein n=1 Tax=Tanacetum cinerariifolium TaxID=118510 RepID=A0A6L2LYA5_TANCI|nr:hypothetical protein [Tanacetum cinerariifolium]